MAGIRPNEMGPVEIRQALARIKKEKVSLADVEAHISEILDTISATPGAILVRGASTWTVLLPGTAGQVVMSDGSTPSYQDVDTVVGPAGADGAVGPAGKMNAAIFQAYVGERTRGGSFDVVGEFTDEQIGGPVIVHQMGGIQSKTRLGDEAEFDALHCVGEIVSSTILRVHWSSRTIVRGSYNFCYLVPEIP